MTNWFKGEEDCDGAPLANSLTADEKHENMGRVLEHDGWIETPKGWHMPGGFGNPLPLDSAFKIRTILAELDDTGFPEEGDGE